LRSGVPVLAAIAFTHAVVYAQRSSAPTGMQTISLPSPQTTGGMSLMEALQNRKTTRGFREQELPMQTLSNLLWAAYGINRKTSGSYWPNKPGRPGNFRLKGIHAFSLCGAQRAKLLIMCPLSFHLMRAPTGLLWVYP